MACRFAKVSEEEIEEAIFYPSDLVNTKTTIPLRVPEEWWIYTIQYFTLMRSFGNKFLVFYFSTVAVQFPEKLNVS